MPWFLYPLALILLIVSAMYVYYAIKRHERGRGGIVLLIITTLLLTEFLLLNLICRTPPLLGYMIIVFIAAMLTFTQIHLQFHKPTQKKRIDDSSAKQLEQFLRSRRK